MWAQAPLPPFARRLGCRRSPLPSESGGPGPRWEHPGALEGGPFGPRPFAIATSLGAAPATPAHRGSGTWLRPFANRLAGKLSACLVSSAARREVCGRAESGEGCGMATGGRSSTRVRARPLLWGPTAARRASEGRGARGGGLS